MAGNKKYNQAGISLIEVIVSVLLFTVIIMSATQIFKLVIDAQRSSIATQNVQESLKYFLEVMSKEVRTAKKNQDVCPGIATNRIFATSSNALGDILTFRNYDGECVTYSLDTDGDNQRFQITRDSQSGFISPAKIRIDSLHFVIADSSTVQPSIVVNLKAWALSEGQFNSEMTIQTTITSRYYK
ncbi:MAG: prepilin-type N-terminal cleavage/methylation domain-containing protein [Patescibacteria group bacterium]|jgi:type II secretory pathway component PulJ